MAVPGQVRARENGVFMQINLPGKVRYIIGRLESGGYSAYAVGGCVRDSVLGRVPEDWDITTSARPEQVKRLFPRTIDTGIQHGTVTVMLDREGFEVTTFRIDGEYTDARHPEHVTFTPDLSEDLKRRDFTINAMAYNDRVGFVDEFGGLEDLSRGIVRCVGDPFERFREDALRMLRAVRFSAQLDFSIDPKTWSVMKVLVPNIGKVSAERIQTELVKLLVSDHPERFAAVYDSGMTDVFMREFSIMMETPQNNRHHWHSVGEHTLLALPRVRADRILRLAMLFHDVGKPDCRTTDQFGTDHFARHPEVGAEITKDILRRLKFDNETIHRVCQLVLIHDRRPQLTKHAIRRALSKNGLEYYPDFFAIQRADVLAQSHYQRSQKIAYTDAYEQMYYEILADNDCLTVRDLAVNGSDLIAAGVPKGKAVGEILQKLLLEVLRSPEYNNREYLMRMTKGFLQ